MAETSRRELSFPLIPHAELQSLKPLGPKLEDYIRQLEELLRSLLFGIDAPAYPNAESPLFTPGSVIFAGAGGGLAEDNANFFYDDANNRLGAGLNTPRDTIEVNKRIVFDPTLFNTLIGDSAGNAITTGSSNVIMGYQADYNKTDLSNSVVIGYQANYTEVSEGGGGDVIIGYQAAYGLVAGSTPGQNVIIGYRAAYTDREIDSVVIGYEAGYYMSGGGTYGGQYCVYIGRAAGYGQVTGNQGYQNIAIGYTAMYQNTTGFRNVAIGNLALARNATGQRNIAIGCSAQYGGLTYNQLYCIAIGDSASYSSQTVSDNSVVGYAGLYFNQTGTGNVIFGANAARGTSSKSQSGQTVIGAYAGYNLNDANYDTIIGYYAGNQLTTGNLNVMLGYKSGYSLTTGGSNILLGPYAGYYQTTGSNLFLLDNQSRSVANYELYESILYGVMAATSGAQDLTINADTVIRNDATMGSESLNETDFTTHAKWDTTGDFNDTGGNATYTHATGAGTLIQTQANMAVAGAANKWYKFTYTVSDAGASTTTVTITTAFAATAVSLPKTVGTHTIYFQAAAAPTNFVILVASTAADTFVFDNVTLKELQGGDLTVNGALSARSFTSGGGAIPAGLDSYIQYNNGGVMGGDSALTWDDIAKSLTIGSCAVLGPNSAVFQPTADSTTFFQILDADGGTPVFNVDSTNERIGIGTATPNNKLQVAGLVQFDDTNYNVLLGTEAFNNDPGKYNLGIGYQAGYNNDASLGGVDNGRRNLFIGYQAGKGSAAYNNADNIGIGSQALLNLSGAANRNTAIGTYALVSLTSGIRSTAIGYAALYYNTASETVGIGYRAGYSNSTGARNFYLGSFAGYFNKTGADNWIAGYEAGLGVTGNSYSNNTVAGSRALYSVTVGSQNSIYGMRAGYLLTTGSSNVFLGYLSGYNQTTNSNLLIIDNQNRGTVAAEATNSLIYGTFAADPVNQKLIINATSSNSNRVTTLGLGATTFAVKSNVMTVTGDGGGNTIATITGANSGTLLTLIFVDGNVTITDDNTHAADSVDLSAAFTSADDTTLQLVYDGTSWYEISRSIN